MTLWVDPPGAEALATRLRAMAAEVDESLSRAGAWEVMAAAAAVGLQRAITQADGVGAVQAARCVAEVETAVLQVVARVHALRGETLALAGAFVGAARVLGASGWQIFYRVTLPNVKCALLYGVILCNARAFGEFGAVSVVSGHIRGQTNTLPLHIEILYNEYQFAAAFAVASLLALLALVTLALKYAVEQRVKAQKYAATDPNV